MEIGLAPIRNFAQISENMYRSAQPIYGYEFKWLKNILKLDLIVNLRAEKNIDEYWSSVYGIKSHTISVKDHHIPSDEQIDEFFSLLKENKEKRVLIHCEHGRGRTSLFTVVSRIYEGWTLEKALQEEEEKFNYKFQHKEQLDYLKNKFKK